MSEITYLGDLDFDSKIAGRNFDADHFSGKTVEGRIQAERHEDGPSIMVYTDRREPLNGHVMRKDYTEMTDAINHLDDDRFAGRLILQSMETI